MEADVLEQWWGSFEVPEGQEGRFEVSALQLWVRHVPGEWRLKSLVDDERQAQPFSWSCQPVDSSAAPSEASLLRLVTRANDDRVFVRPALADRAIVVHTETPMLLLPNQSVELFMGLPLWVVVSQTENGEPLLDLPIWRPSDTWFGPPTQEGELCYAGRTSARLNMADMPVRSNLAWTVIKLRNTGKRALPFERLRVPGTSLGLYAAQNGWLWTETVHIDKRGAAFQTEARLGEPPREVAGPLERVSRSRAELSGTPLARALRVLVG